MYDAAGLNVEADNNRLRVTQSYDGDGRAVKRVERRYDDNGVLVETETARYVHSTALGGASGADQCLYNGIGMDCEDALMVSGSNGDLTCFTSMIPRE